MKIKIGDNSLNLKAGGSLANIDRGPRGYSAYEIAVQEGFVGTEEEWLASLVGPEGPRGKDGGRGPEGPRGKEGPRGETGEDGYTPVKGVDYFTPEDIESLNIPEKVSDLDNDSGFITNNVNNLVNYTLKTNTGSLIDLSIDNTDYVVTLKLKNQDGTIISTDTIDLPLESVVVGGRYDSTNKKIVLTLENGNTVDIPVGDLIAGLQTEITSVNKLASDLVDDTNSGNKFTNISEKQTWNNKYDKPSGGIPKNDLASDVQTSLGKADTALQEHQDLTDYVKNTNYATSSKGGVVKTGNDFLINSQGVPYARVYSDSNYGRAGTGNFISKGTLEYVIQAKELINQTTLDESQAEQDANIEENASNIDWLQTLVNQMPTVSGQGTDLSLQDVLNYRLMKFLPQGVSSQFSTTGKNLLNSSSIDQVTKNGVTCTYDSVNQEITFNGNCNADNTSFGIPNNTINFTKDLTTTSAYYVSGTVNGYAYIRSYSDDYSYSNQLDISTLNSNNLVVNKTTTLNFIGMRHSIRFNNGTVLNNFKIKLMIAQSTNNDYEPYTGGISAPNPSYPFMPSRVTGENSVVLQNGNLLNRTTCEENKLIRWVQGDTYNEAGSLVSDYIRVNVGNNISCSYACQKAFYDKDKNYIGVLNDNGTIIPSGTNANILSSFVVPNISNVYYMRLGFRSQYTSGTDLLNSNIMVNKGETLLDYVPHQEQNYPLSLGNIELNSSPDGTIRDGIIGTPNNWFKREYIGKVVLDGSENWTKSNSASSSDYLVCYFTSTSPKGNNYQSSLSNYFIYGVVGSSSSSNCFQPYTSGDNIGFNIKISTSIADTANNFKAWLSTHNTTIYYQKSQYIDIPITDTTLISQLNDIYENAHSYNGTTNITTTYADGNEQMYLDIEALKNVWSDLTTRVEVLESEV